MAELDASSAVAHDNLYTMRELNQHTAEVLKKINEGGEVALVTRHGRFVAAIVPLAGKGLESELAARVINSLERSGQLTGKSTIERAYETEDLANELRVNLPEYREKKA